MTALDANLPIACGDDAMPDRAASRALWLIGALLAIAFFIAEQDVRASRLEEFAVEADQMEQDAAGGSMTRRLGFSLVALVGIGCLMMRPKHAISFRDPLPLLLLLYFSWCVASVAWSEDTASSLRRVAVLACCFLGMVGVSRQLSLRQLCALALALTSLYVFVGMGAELVLCTFRPWSGEYRFAGTVHPNSQGAFCATLCLSALCMSKTNSGRDYRILALLAVGAVMLYFTRSRTSVMALAAALVALGLAARVPSRTKLLAVALAGFAIVALLLTATLLGYNVHEQLANAVLLGRQQDAESFNGRVPLWGELLTQYAAKRPLCGYGYGAFWNADHIADLSGLFYWGIREAHSAYVEALIGVGLIGGSLLLGVVTLGLYRSYGAYRATGDPAVAFVLAILVFAVVYSIMESSYILAGYPQFLVACALVSWELGSKAGRVFQPVGCSDGLENPSYGVLELK